MSSLSILHFPMTSADRAIFLRPDPDRLAVSLFPELELAGNPPFPVAIGTVDFRHQNTPPAP